MTNKTLIGAKISRIFSHRKLEKNIPHEQSTFDDLGAQLKNLFFA